ncbi:metallophosphoesterase [Brachyspira sp. G79]|uniref:metallophosphoesterase n=1 Tax=Brachyspira sp. G79 TaxID=1358104 RepID=UPI000BBBE222|nr:metallophosphoesterase [Brachyspira sp. G79]PCG18763.1 phosphodiesterase [Brachyspira sp. G79]
MNFLQKILKINKIIFLITILFFICVTLYMYKTAHSLRVRYITLEFEDLPESFDNTKIALAADMHAGLYIPESHIKNMSALITNENPDIILFAGDYIYSAPHKFSHYNEENTKKFANGIKGLEAKYGNYAVLGNHDNWESTSDVSNALYSNGFKVIDNNILFITNEMGEYISIGGVGDFLTDNVDFEAATKNVKSNDFHILLSHEPNIPLKRAKDKGYTEVIDLFLSGHTHGLQISFLPMWVWEGLNKNKEYPHFPVIYGIMNYGKMKVYVTSGIGAVLMPFRLLAYPEVVIINLNRK